MENTEKTDTRCNAAPRSSSNTPLGKEHTRPGHNNQLRQNLYNLLQVRPNPRMEPPHVPPRSPADNGTQHQDHQSTQAQARNPLAYGTTPSKDRPSTSPSEDDLTQGRNHHTKTSEDKPTLEDSTEIIKQHVHRQGTHSPTEQ